jgi:hypothetical protein
MRKAPPTKHPISPSPSPKNIPRGDFNSHYFHHSKGRGRKHYFNLGFLTPTWDVIMGTRWHPEHPLWLQWKDAEKKGLAKDTRDGSASGVPNTEWLSVSATEGKLVLPEAPS